MLYVKRHILIFEFPNLYIVLATVNFMLLPECKKRTVSHSH